MEITRMEEYKYKMKTQLSFPFIQSTKLVHGGEYSKGIRKSVRPLKLNKPIHLVLRANRSGLKMKEWKIKNIIKIYADKFKIKVYEKSINSNHIHLLIVTSRRDNFQNYLRSITGLIAKTMGSKKLWSYLAFSRMANWGKEFKILTAYIIQNQNESLGFISFKPRTG